MDVVQLVDKARHLSGCDIYPARGQPKIAEDHSVPPNLRTFYQLCGGMALFSQSEYPMTILPPDKCVPANPLIVGELCEYDITSSWYTIACDNNREFISIDLAPVRLGKCYDSFYDRHGVRGSCAVIARSFSELLERLLDNQGGYYYWLSPDFEPLGDAYD